MNDAPQTESRVLDRVKVSKARILVDRLFVGELKNFELTFYANGHCKVTDFGDCLAATRELIETGQGLLEFDTATEKELTAKLQAKRTEQEIRAAIADEITPVEIRRRLRMQLYPYERSTAHKFHQMEERMGFNGVVKPRPLQALNKPGKPLGMTGRQFRNWRKRNARESRTRASTVNTNTASI